MNMKYAVLVVWDCDADRVIWRGDYVFCKFIQSDCCKIGDEKYVSGKYSIDEIQQLSKNRWIVKKVYGEICRFFQTWMKKNVCKFGISYQSNFQLTFSREFSDCFKLKMRTRIQCFEGDIYYQLLVLGFITPMTPLLVNDIHCLLMENL